MKANETGSNIFLTACILLANLDFSGLLDYGIKAVIGGAVWLGYKLMADYLEKRKMQNNNTQKPNGI